MCLMYIIQDRGIQDTGQRERIMQRRGEAYIGHIYTEDSAYSRALQLCNASGTAQTVLLLPLPWWYARIENVKGAADTTRTHMAWQTHTNAHLLAHRTQHIHTDTDTWAPTIPRQRPTGPKCQQNTYHGAHRSDHEPKTAKPSERP